MMITLKNSAIILLSLLAAAAVSCSKNTAKAEAQTDELERIVKTGSENFDNAPIKNYKVPAALGRGYTVDNNVRIRKEPNTSSEIIGVLNFLEGGAVYEMTKEKSSVNGSENYWYKIKRDYNTYGWVFGDYLIIDTGYVPPEFEDRQWITGFGKLEPKETLTLKDLQNCSLHRYFTLLQFSEEGNYAIGDPWSGADFGTYQLENNIISFWPPLIVNRFDEYYRIDKLYYSNELYFEGTPVFKNDDESVIFWPHSVKEPAIGDIVKKNQQYCEVISGKAKINKNNILYALPLITSKNLFLDNPFGDRAMETTAYTHLKTTIDDAVWYYINLDFSSDEPSDGGGPYYYGWLPAEYLKE